MIAMAVQIVGIMILVPLFMFMAIGGAAAVVFVPILRYMLVLIGLLFAVVFVSSNLNVF